jgi:hypothetical protein
VVLTSRGRGSTAIDSALTSTTRRARLTLGIALLSIGVGGSSLAKKLLPEEVSVQDRHDGVARRRAGLTGATWSTWVDEIGVHAPAAAQGRDRAGPAAGRRGAGGGRSAA